LVDLSVELAAEMVLMGERADSIEDARRLCRGAIADGSALDRFRRVVAAQGGDPRAVDDPGRLPTARRRVDLPSSRSGFVQAISAWPIGHATMLLGAGRSRVDSVIDPAVGLILHKKTGDPVEKGDPLCTVLIDSERSIDAAFAMVRDAYSIGDSPPDEVPLVVERL
jgi:thymidine phosphorylase